MEIRRILVAVDFSACSAVAVAYAAELGRLVGATVRVLHVTGGGGAAQRGIAAAKELERLVTELQKEGCGISGGLRSGRVVPCVEGFSTSSNRFWHVGAE